MFRVVPVHARDNGPGVSVLSRNIPLDTGTYYMPVGLSIHLNMNRVSPLPKGIYHGDYGTPDRQAGE